MFGHNNFKRFFKIPQNTYQEYQLTNSQEDVAKMNEFSNALRSISKKCFKSCVDCDVKDFSKKEEKCVEDCISFHHEAMINLVRKYQDYNYKEKT